MQYKVSLWDEKWSPLINMWNYVPNGSVELPMGQPKLLKSTGKETF
jgi:hypothetical protein